MTVVRDQQRVYSSGEISPLLHDRDDLELWRTGMKVQDGMVTMPEGGLTQLPGSDLIAPVKDSASPPLIIAFVFKDDPTQSYILEFGYVGGNGYMRAHTEAGTVIDSGDSSIVEVTTPWNTAQLAKLQYVQQDDIVFFVDGENQPQRLERRDHDDWQLVPHDFIDGPYDARNIDDERTLTPSGTSGSITVTASTDTFVASDVGRHLRLFESGEWGWGKITAFASATSVTVAIERNLAASAATKDWRIGAFGAGPGWPSSVGFFEDRICFGKDNKVYTSVSGDFAYMAPTTENPTSGKITNETVATDAIVKTMLGARVGKIIWLQEGTDALVVGTTTGIRGLKNKSTSESGLAPENAVQLPENSSSAGRLQPVQLESGNLLFASQHRTRMSELGYNLESNRKEAVDRTRISRHLLTGKVKGQAYQSEPYNILWFNTDAGELRSYTYVPDERVFAIAPQPVAGAYNGGPAQCLSIAVIPGEKQDKLWFVARRTVNGQTFCSIECQADFFEPVSATDRAGCHFVQSARRYSGGPFTELTNLGHLEGEIVQVFADGADLGDFPVIGGKVDLDGRSVTEAVCGLGYRARVVTLGIPGSIIRDGAASTRITKPLSNHLSILHSLGYSVGQEGKALRRPVTRKAGDAANAPEPWVTERRKTDITGDDSGRGEIEIVQDRPLPLTIRATIPTYDSRVE